MTWSNRKVLVTGADGFIGSHLVEALHAAGAQVRALCLYNSFGSLGWLDEHADSGLETLDVRLGDVRDAGFVEEICRDVEVVFHLAALISVPYSYLAPSSFVETNVNGTLNVLEGVRRAGCLRMVQTSTSEVYGSPDTVPITERHPVRGQSPYSASKIAADKMSEAYHAAFGTPVTILRPFNVFGPRQSQRAVIPTVLAQILSGRDEIVLGSTHPRRDFTYVTDCVAGFLAAGSVPDLEGTTIHLGTGESRSIGEIAEIAQEVCNRRVRVITDAQRVRPALSEVDELLSDPTEARTRLGWKPQLDFRSGLQRTAEWVAANIERFRPYTYLR